MTDSTPLPPSPQPASAPASTPVRASLRFMLSHPAHVVSLGFGSGLSPLMPGTAGTLFGWLTFVLLDRFMTPAAWIALIVAGFVGGVALTGYTARRLGIADPGPAVWDEIVAIWLVLLFVMPASFAAQLAAFLLFRFFDMVKPPPIGWLDRRVKGGFGIMVDDLVAAFMTLFVIALYRFFFMH